MASGVGGSNNKNQCKESSSKGKVFSSSIPRSSSLASLSKVATKSHQKSIVNNTFAKNFEEWSNYFGRIDGKFSLYFGNDALSDVTFVVGDKKIRAHKLILSACSWEFYNIFNLLKLDKKKEVTIQDTSYDAFVSFLEFCYTGWTLLLESLTWDILKLAYRFDVKQLICVCESHLIKRLTINTCWNFYMKGSFLNIKSALRGQIMEIVKEDFLSLFYHKQFNCLPLKALREIVGMKLNCEDLFVFEALIKWAKFNCIKAGLPCVPKNFRYFLKDVFFMIRFPAMPAHVIFEILAEYPGILTQMEISNIARISTDMAKTAALKVKKSNENLLDLKDALDSTDTTNDNEKKLEKSHEPTGSDGTTERVLCYRNYPEKIYCQAFKSSLIFKCDVQKNLIGFGYFTKTEQRSKIVSCILHYINSHPTIQKNCSIAEDEHKFWKTHLDVYYHESHFMQKLQLNPGQWYSIICTFADKLQVLQTPPIKSYDEKSKVHFRKLIPNVIPYLIFDKNK